MVKRASAGLQSGFESHQVRWNNFCATLLGVYPVIVKENLPHVGFHNRKM